MQPRNTHIMQAWAVMESRRGNARRAIELFERAIETRPSDAGIYNAYATLSKDLGDVEGARRQFELADCARLLGRRERAPVRSAYDFQASARRCAPCASAVSVSA